MLKIIRNIVIFLLFITCTSYAGNVLLLDVVDETSYAKRQLNLACRFYGLKVENFIVGDEKNGLQFPSDLNLKNMRAIVITKRVMDDIKLQSLLNAFQEHNLGKVPLLIIGLTPDTDSALLVNWSGGAIVRCKRNNIVPFNGFYRISDLKVLAQQLSGLQIPFKAEKVNYFIFDTNSNVQTVAQYVNSQEDSGLPFFVKLKISGHEIFYLADIPSSGLLNKLSSRFMHNRFVEIAPLMMFLRYACGEHCWHNIGNYANLTIDDPWLTESYGHLTYKGLLKEMNKSNFHTTIAFIPWNYDRSKSDVVFIFRNNPNRFSICIHGNDHDHQEFYKYEIKLGDSWSAKPLDVQEANIKQALARMEKFRKITDISYDRLMIFPHGIAPAKTLGLLKKYNFIATVNSNNVPLGSHEPTEPFFRLRRVTVQFENFPSLNRYTPNRIQSDIAIDLFLDNPILFYAHHDFFEDGIDAFNKTAEMVNNIHPDIIWKSLGYICQHLYLEKLRDDSCYDVLAFSSNLILENTHKRDLTYFVRKEESFSFPIKQVTVDGQPCSYKKSGSDLVLEVYIPVAESRHLIIEYENDLNLESIDISKNDSRVNRLRKFSDFRDMTLSKNMIGRTFSHFYYDTGLYRLGLMRLAILIIVLAILTTFGIWYFKRRRKRQNKF